MSDPAVPPPPASPAPAASEPQTDFDIGEEYGTARKTLPPAKILAICVGAVALIIAVYSLTHRAHTRSTGSIDNVVAVAMPGQDAVLVAINISIQNNEMKPAWIKSIQVAADVGGNQLTDDAAPAVDAQRYLQAMPDLKQHALEPIAAETRINPGSKISGTLIASFAVKADAFGARKSLTVTVTPYDELPIVMTR